MADSDDPFTFLEQSQAQLDYLEQYVEEQERLHTQEQYDNQAYELQEKSSSMVKSGRRDSDFFHQATLPALVQTCPSRESSPESLRLGKSSKQAFAGRSPESPVRGEMQSPNFQNKVPKKVDSFQMQVDQIGKLESVIATSDYPGCPQSTWGLQPHASQEMQTPGLEALAVKQMSSDFGRTPQPFSKQRQKKRQSKSKEQLLSQEKGGSALQAGEMQGRQRSFGDILTPKEVQSEPKFEVKSQTNQEVVLSKEECLSQPPLLRESVEVVNFYGRSALSNYKMPQSQSQIFNGGSRMQKAKSFAVKDRKASDINVFYRNQRSMHHNIGSHPQKPVESEDQLASEQQLITEGLDEADEDGAALLHCVVQLFQKFKPFEHQKGLHLKAMRDVCQRQWQRPVFEDFETYNEIREAKRRNKNHEALNETFNNAAQEEQEMELYTHKVGQLVSLQKRMNFLAKKKVSYQANLEVLRQKLKQQKAEYAELKKVYQYYEFQTYEEIMEEIQTIMQSNEYHSSDYLQEQVSNLKKMAPGLERYGRAKEYIKKLQDEIRELEHFFKDTRDDLRRLKVREKFILKQKPTLQAFTASELSARLTEQKSVSNISHLSYFTSNSIVGGMPVHHGGSKWGDSEFELRQRLGGLPHDEEESSSDESSSRSLRSMIRDENYFMVKTNSFINF